MFVTTVFKADLSYWTMMCYIPYNIMQLFFLMQDFR